MFIFTTFDLISKMGFCILTEIKVILHQRKVLLLDFHLGWMNVLKNEKRYSWMLCIIWCYLPNFLSVYCNYKWCLVNSTSSIWKLKRRSMPKRPRKITCRRSLRYLSSQFQCTKFIHSVYDCLDFSCQRTFTEVWSLFVYLVFNLWILRYAGEPGGRN